MPKTGHLKMFLGSSDTEKKLLREDVLHKDTALDWVLTWGGAKA